MTTNELALPDVEPGDLVVHRPPEVVLEEAQRAAVALKRVLDAKPKPVIFNGETYLEHEDWLTVGRFYGISPRVTSTHFVQFGDVSGWEASADAVHVASGRIVSAAEAMCLNDEEKWRARPKYEYHYVRKSDGVLVAEDPGKDELVWEEKAGKRFPKKERKLVGEEPVPLFQLRSMAQTRACAKSMRIALGWVVTLAGYRATPAEELPDHGRDEAAPTNAGATPTNGTAAQPRADGSALVIGIETKTGRRHDGTLWTAYLVKLDDGRQGSTFDEGLAKAAQAAKDAGVFVIPTLEKKETKRGPVVNLTRLVDVEPAGDGETGGSITADQVDRLLATARGMGWTDDDLEKFYTKHAVAFPQEFRADDYPTLLNELKQGPKGA